MKLFLDLSQLNPPPRIKARPWMSPSLIRLRNIKRAAGKRANRSHSLSDIVAYQELNKEFTERNCQEYTMYVRRQGQKLISDPKKFWSFIDERRKCSGLPNEMSLDDESANGSVNTANLIARHFSSVYSMNQTVQREALNFSAPSIDRNARLSEPLNNGEVVFALKQLNANKGAGHDEFPPRFWKELADELSKPLTTIFNSSLTYGVFPSFWKIPHVVPIHKSGLRSNVKNYRPISILSHILIVPLRSADQFSVLLNVLAVVLTT